MAFSQSMSSHDQTLLNSDDTTQSSAAVLSQGADANEFDGLLLLLQDLEQQNGSAAVSTTAIEWLRVWQSQHGDELPTGIHLSALEALTDIPRLLLKQWLLNNGRFATTSVSRTSAAFVGASDSPATTPQCRVRSSDTSSRRTKQHSVHEQSSVLECTNGCGRKFSKRRKGDWKRHERMNFEDWPCSHCKKAFRRKEHLKKHLGSHNAQPEITQHRPRKLFSPAERPCGFCHEKPKTWCKWLSHVADHFLGKIPGGHTMSDWEERRTVQEVEPVDDTSDIGEDVPTFDGDDAAEYRQSHINDETHPSAGYAGAQFDEYITYPSLPHSLTEKPDNEEVFCLFENGMPIATTFHQISEDPNVESLNASMAALAIHDVARDHRLHKGAASSNHSCSCHECAQRLELAVPAVQHVPGAFPVSKPCSRLRSPMLERYLTDTARAHSEKFFHIEQ